MQDMCVQAVTLQCFTWLKYMLLVSFPLMPAMVSMITVAYIVACKTAASCHVQYTPLDLDLGSGGNRVLLQPGKRRSKVCNVGIFQDASIILPKSCVLVLKDQSASLLCQQSCVCWTQSAPCSKCAPWQACSCSENVCCKC